MLDGSRNNVEGGNEVMTEVTEGVVFANSPTQELVAALAVCKVALEIHTDTNNLADQCHSRFDLAAIQAANTALSSFENRVGSVDTINIQFEAISASREAGMAREKLIEQGVVSADECDDDNHIEWLCDVCNLN
jgi:hypothetical protein